MKLYIAGPVTGRENLNFGEFLMAKKQLIKSGYEAYIPHDFIPSVYDWYDAMITSIKVMLSFDGLALLEDWDQSKGARIERDLAIKIGLPANEVSKWLGRAGK